ncbi:MarR family transcriptional regulator [Streptomonospora sp. S1-112]|uniref:MarR family transcriptional regulator n=1 Tax=Streptomonospora mangrovi TaxID=2883123 RepID=A0A9X3SGU0_9ACTN|nr:MarR family transcriptional regulator [Streptomonospora mangrovi]MDA0566280.1 MarR family transcriptional regulator [Streptomonospora mangrovi]
MRPAEELRYLILAAQREGNRILARRLQPLGVTPSQAEVLRLLLDRGPLTLKGLGELLVCESGGSPSRLVDRLHAAGLVHREVPAHDRRQVTLTLTDAGRRVAEEVAGVEEDLHARIESAAQGRALDEATAFLRSFVAGLPSGDAVARRRGTASG